DYKPSLDRLHGQRFDPGRGQLVESVTNSPGFKVLRSPFGFRRYGESGRWVSDVFPETAKLVDKFAFLMSMTSPTNVHGLASYMQNTGSTIPGFPCAGAWVSYALGSMNRDLPNFVVLPDAKGLPYNNLGNFSSGFLPVEHQGTVIHASRKSPISFLNPPAGATGLSAESERDGLQLFRALGRSFAAKAPQDSRIRARVEAYEMAARLQLSAPELFDLRGESAATKKLYGLDAGSTKEFGNRCLLARRMVERGVRFVQVWSGAGGPTNNWDNHGNISTELPNMAKQTDLPVAGLIRDLESRGLLEDTLVMWTTEFGRMPFSQGQAGRDHNGGTFVTWLAGGGVREGVSVGQSDPWGWKAVEKITSHDLYATMLELLGLDHHELTYSHQGFDRKLSDVEGEVIDDIVA
ncbi:MAG: DUF1501 domain-containing protein, partial [Planctomycetota bacterium]